MPREHTNSRHAEAGQVSVATEFLGSKVKSPVISASSEVNLNVDLVEQIIEAGVGAVVLKTWTSEDVFKIRVRPYQFPLRKLDSMYETAGSLLSLSAPDIRSADEFFSELPRLVELCAERDVLLIASFYEKPGEIGKWITTSKRLKQAGVEIIELNFSSPSAVSEFRKDFALTNAIIRAVLDHAGPKVGVKIGPDIEPLEDIVQQWQEAGIAYIAAHNAFTGIVVDVDHEEFFGAPCLCGYAMGRPFLPVSLARIARIKQVSDLPIIGTGGVFTGRDALQYLLIGCDLVGICTVLFLHGRSSVARITKEIIEWMRKKGYHSVGEFRGKLLNSLERTSEVKSRERFPSARPPEAPLVPKIDTDLCNRCGKCVDVCIYGALELGPNTQVTVHAEKCFSCGLCTGICPTGAIGLVFRNDPNTIAWSGRGTAMTLKKTSVEGK